MYSTDPKTGVNYYTAAETYLVGKTEMDKELVQKYLDTYNIDYKAPDSLVEFAGKHCYMVFKQSKDFVKKLIKSKHFSVLEHVSFTILLRGVSRIFTHEMVRHRHFSFSQTSTRYCSKFNYVVPVELRGKNLDEFFQECSRHTEKYGKETDRYFLPHCIEAPIVISGNLRCYLEMFEKRISPMAALEIKDVAEKIKNEIKVVIGDII